MRKRNVSADAAAFFTERRVRCLLLITVALGGTGKRTRKIKMPKFQYELNGHVGLKAIAKANATSVESIRRRFNNGMNIEEAISDILARRAAVKKSKAKVKKMKQRKPPGRKPAPKFACRYPDKLSDLWCLALGISQGDRDE